MEHAPCDLFNNTAGLIQTKKLKKFYFALHNTTDNFHQLLFFDVDDLSCCC